MKIRLNKNFYEESEVKETISFFKENEIGDLSYKDKKKSFVVEFKKIKQEFEDVAIDEFYNSLIVLKKEKANKN